MLQHMVGVESKEACQAGKNFIFLLSNFYLDCGSTMLMKPYQGMMMESKM